MAYGEMTPADYAAVTGNSNGGFGGDWGGSIWAIILIIALLGGFNGNGWGSNGNGTQDVKDGYTLASDFATLERQIDSGFRGVDNKNDSIQEQLCMMSDSLASQFASTNTNLLTNAANLNNTLATNFATTNANLMNGFAGVNQGISANRYENQLAIGSAQNGITNAVTDLGSQLQSCCCDMRYNNLQNANALQSQLANMNYDNAMANNGLQNAISNGFCTSNYNAATNTRDIVDAINASARATQDMIAANRLDDLKLENDRLRTQLNNATLAASQAAQTNEIVDQLRPNPVPAFAVPNPFNYNNGYGCNSCGCNGGF